MECCLVVPGISFDRAEVSGFPHAVGAIAILVLCVPGGVECEAMGVEMRVRRPVLGPAREMHKLAPNHVAGRTGVELAVITHPALRFMLQLLHGFANRVAERRQYAIVSRQRPDRTDVLGAIECKVIANPTSFPCACRQTAAGGRVEVLAQVTEGASGHFTREPKPLSSLAAPLAGKLLSFDVVVAANQRLVEVTLRSSS